jgi:hypothetical protein
MFHRTQITYKTLDLDQRQSAAWPTQLGEPG